MQHDPSLPKKRNINIINIPLCFFLTSIIYTHRISHFYLVIICKSRSRVAEIDRSVLPRVGRSVKVQKSKKSQEKRIKRQGNKDEESRNCTTPDYGNYTGNCAALTFFTLFLFRKSIFTIFLTCYLYILLI